MKQEEQIEEVLDSLLLEIIIDEVVDEATLKRNIEKKFPFKLNVQELLIKLSHDGYIRQQSSMNPSYRGTVHGKLFINDGGYQKEKYREEHSFNITRKNFFWTVIAALASIIAVVIAGISLYIQMK